MENREGILLSGGGRKELVAELTENETKFHELAEYFKNGIHEYLVSYLEKNDPLFEYLSSKSSQELFRQLIRKWIKMSEHKSVTVTLQELELVKDRALTKMIKIVDKHIKSGEDRAKKRFETNQLFEDLGDAFRGFTEEPKIIN